MTVDVVDDDGGAGADTAVAIVTGNADLSKGSGYWLNQYRLKPPNLVNSFSLKPNGKTSSTSRRSRRG